MNLIGQIVKDFWSARNLIFSLAKNDFKTRYAGSYFGMFWAFANPIMTILIFWFVFEVGFRSTAVRGVPYILWLCCGLIPWFFFSDAWANITGSFLDYSYLIRKVFFRVSALPIIKLLAALFVHGFFLGILLIMFLLYGYTPTWYWLQIPYYLFCTIVLLLGTGYFTASIAPFFRDTQQIVGIILQFGMWINPIMWPVDVLSEQYQWILLANPMAYIVEGYRHVFIQPVWFWEHFDALVVFWVGAIPLLLLGGLVFRKLRPHFADVL